MHQTSFQRHLWLVALDAHACGDRADSRILLRMIEVIDEGNYSGLVPLVAALRAEYRTRLGRVPKARSEDVGGQQGEAAGNRA